MMSKYNVSGLSVYNDIVDNYGNDAWIVIFQVNLCQELSSWFIDVEPTDTLLEALTEYFRDRDFNSSADMLRKIYEYCEDNEMTIDEYLYGKGYLDIID